MLARAAPSAGSPEAGPPGVHPAGTPQLGARGGGGLLRSRLFVDQSQLRRTWYSVRITVVSVDWLHHSATAVRHNCT